jgi:hypothetical protein
MRKLIVGLTCKGNRVEKGEVNMKKFFIGEYKVEEDKEYLEYLEREKREAHLSIYDDYCENSDENWNEKTEKKRRG